MLALGFGWHPLANMDPKTSNNVMTLLSSSAAETCVRQSEICKYACACEILTQSPHYVNPLMSSRGCMKDRGAARELRHLGPILA